MTIDPYNLPSWEEIRAMERRDRRNCIIAALIAAFFAWVFFPGVAVFSKGLAVLTLGDLICLIISAGLGLCAAFAAIGAVAP